MMYVGWILFIISAIWFWKSYKYSQVKRIHLNSYIIFLLLRDNVREDHKQKFVDWVQNTEFKDANMLSIRASKVIEDLADRWAASDEGNLLLASHGLLWNLKRGELK
jgi:hypothetical protein